MFSVFELPRLRCALVSPNLNDYIIIIIIIVLYSLKVSEKMIFVAVAVLFVRRRTLTSAVEVPT